MVTLAKGKQNVSACVCHAHARLNRVFIMIAEIGVVRQLDLIRFFYYNGVATAEGTGFWTPEVNRT